MIDLRRAELHDIDRVAQFQVAMALETEELALDLPTVLRGVRAVLETPGRGFYLVASVNGEVQASMLVLSEWSDWRNREVWWIHSVYVTPEHRRRALFRRMFTFIEALARESEIAGLRLFVDKRNTRAQAVYRALGMGNEHYELFEKML